MRIAYISLMSGLPWGGSEAYWSEKAFESLAEGNQVMVSVYNWGNETHPKIKELQKAGASIHLRTLFSHQFPLHTKIINYFKNRIAYFDTTWQELIVFKPDKVIINQGSNVDLMVHHYNLFLQLKNAGFAYQLVCHSHPQFSFIPDSLVYPRGQAVFTGAEKVLFVSNRQKTLTERALCIHLYNAEIFRNPLNLKQHNYLPYPENAIIQFAIVGALVSGKGHDTLFEVLAQPQWQNRNWQLNIYGKGYGLEYLTDLSAYFGISNKVKFCGHVGSATEIWEQNHLLLIPSDGEGLPISLVEAAVSGRTAVVTDVGGNTEIINDNQTGFVAPAPTPHSFSEALERAWLRKEDWKAMGEQLSIEVLGKLGKDKI